MAGITLQPNRAAMPSPTPVAPQAPLPGGAVLDGVGSGGVRSGGGTSGIGLGGGSYGIDARANPVPTLATPGAAPAPASRPTLGLTGSVGSGGRNQPEDVARVQRRLDQLGFHVDVDGVYGPQTQRAIQRFAASTYGTETIHQAQSRIDKGGALERALAAPDAARWVPVPAGGPGWVSVDRDGYGWATDQTVRVLGKAGAAYERDYRKGNASVSRILLNDASREDGNVRHRRGRDEHITHRNGLSFDIRLPSTAGEDHGAKTGWRSYDREAMYAILDAFGSEPAVRRMFLWDTDLAARAARDGKTWAHKLILDREHVDHLHVDVRPPRVDPDEQVRDGSPTAVV